jgi:hypothetical protein
MTFLNDPAGSAFCVQFPALFDNTMNACQTVLGPGCFRLPKKGDGPRRPISMALFETVGYMMIELMEEPDEKHEGIKKGLTKLLSDKDFILSTTYTVDSNISVYKRFERVETIIQEIRNA